MTTKFKIGDAVAFATSHDIFPCDIIVSAGLPCHVSAIEADGTTYVTPDHVVYKNLAEWGNAIELHPDVVTVDEMLVARSDGPVLDDLIAEYAAWNGEQGLKLGSADEHFFDEALTEAQRQWLRDFSQRWEEAAEREQNQ